MKQVLYLIDTQNLKEKWDSMLQKGLEYNPHNPSIKALHRYRNLNAYAIEANSVLLYSFMFTFIGGIEQFGGIGAGICDNFLHRVERDRVFSALSSVMSERLFTIEKRFLFNLIPPEQYTANRRVDSLPRSEPLLSAEDTALLAVVPPGFRHSSLISEAKSNIEDICALRSKLKTVLIFGPEMSGVELVGAVLRTSFYPSTSFSTSRVDVNCMSEMNHDIIRNVGCMAGVNLTTPECMVSLRSLSDGFLINIPRNEQFWSNLTQSIYQQRLLRASEETLVLVDPLFSFTAPLWQGPLGEVEAVLVLMKPLEAVNCLSHGKQLPPQDAVRLWLHYFKSVLSASASFERVHLMDVTAGSSASDLIRTMRNINPLSTILDQQGKPIVEEHMIELNEKFMCDISAGSGVHNNSEVVMKMIPEWVDICYESMVRTQQISAQLCMIHIS
jgi:hypothetical protein